MSADRPPFLNPISRHAPFSPLSEAIAAPPVEAQVNRSNLRSYRTKNILSTPSIPEEPGTPKSYYPPVNNPFDSIGSENTDSSDVDAAPANRTNPKVVIERPTPERGRSLASSDTPTSEDVGRPTLTVAATPQRLRPTIASRRHSPISDSGDRLFSALYRVEKPAYRPLSARMSSRANEMKPQIRRVWVKRLGSNTSPTQIIVGEDDLVDDLRDMVLRKYANSLGRTFDAPDVSLKLVHRRVSARHSNHERILSPEENILQVIELFYPGGQTVEEALIVETPQRRTPKHSPRIALPYYMTDHLRPGENAGEYFPPMANTRPHSPSISNHPPPLQSQHRSTAHAIAVLETGQLPDLPSPGSRMTRHSHRPRNPRTHTSSPTVISGGSNLSNHETVKSIASQPMHTPPIPNIASEHAKQITPPARVSSPRLSKVGRRTRKPTSEKELPTSSPNAQQAALDKSVPPINVLIVEDNIINLRLLEAFLKRLKVRWSTAMNGRDAVTKWRTGGFHLVLMDIQLPIMNGLAATKEIRRLERVNDIGVFTHSPGHTPSPGTEKTLVQSTEGILINADKLKNLSLFKSSVIIVALTASSLQSDRHEALAAGCNDFLTKPVSFDWLNRKVMEWGCMQALIDFDGWRKWKDLSEQQAKQSTSNSQKGLAALNVKSPATKVAESPAIHKTTNIPSIPSRLGGTGPSSNNGPRATSPTISRSANVNGARKSASTGAGGSFDVSNEQHTSSEAETGTGTDTNGEENNSGAEIAVGA